jgi:3-deoxy-7-phosphoheptulonate synthase
VIVVLRAHSSDAEVREVEDHVRRLGYEPHTIRGVVRTVVAAVGDETQMRTLETLATLPMVENVMPVQKRYKLISREVQPESQAVQVGPHTIGKKIFHVIAGPCSIENLEQFASVARTVGEAGATILRGGAFKPRTSPYDFRGLGERALRIIEKVKAQTGMPIVSEVTSEADIEKMVPVVDMLQIGARNALNYSLLEAVSKTRKPILLKRGMAATIEEWLLAAEYLVKHGNRNVVLCERGIRTFERATRNTLDLSGVALAKLECNLPVIVDPSHAAGRRDIIPALAAAAIAAGADGLMVEVHLHPEEAYSDGIQQLDAVMFSELMTGIEPFVRAAGRELSGAAAGA